MKEEKKRRKEKEKEEKEEKKKKEAILKTKQKCLKLLKVSLWYSRIRFVPSEMSFFTYA